jgi:multicomponent Na+:H+ antiporter subunit D
MTMSLQYVPAAALMVPLVATGLIVLFRRRPNVREAVTIVASVTLFGLVASLVPAVLRGDVVEIEWFSVGRGLDLAWRVDELGIVFAVLASFLWIATSIYSIGYMRGHGESNQTRFYASFAVCLAAVVGLAFAANLFTFFVFYEALTIATYPLVSHSGTAEARAAGRRYLAYLLSGGAALLVALAVLHHSAGSVDFVAGGFAADHLSDAGLVAVCVLFVLAFGSKAAIVPLHNWLPSAMVAPTPVSALLHAVAVVKAGVFGFARAIGYVIGPGPFGDIGAAAVLSVLAAATILIASFVALFQDQIKRRLAFSTIAHLSYIVLGLSLVSLTGWTGGLLHIVNHAALKITLFFVAGALAVHLHYDRVSQLDGVGRRMPVTMGAFAVASVGLAGLPPMGGFVSKWYLVLGGADAGHLALAAVMLVSGVLTAGYLFPIVVRAFFRPLPIGVAGDDQVVLGVRGDASPLMVVPIVVTATLGLTLGLGDAFSLFELVSRNADAVIGGGP